MIHKKRTSVLSVKMGTDILKHGKIDVWKLIFLWLCLLIWLLSIVNYPSSFICDNNENGKSAIRIHNVLVFYKRYGQYHFLLESFFFLKDVTLIWFVVHIVAYLKVSATNTVEFGIWKHEYGLNCCFQFPKQSQNVHWSQ
jgi:hypothetical protein